MIKNGERVTLPTVGDGERGLSKQTALNSGKKSPMGISGEGSPRQRVQ